MRFSIKFNEADPRHRKAAQVLNDAGRRKATVIANAICDWLEENDGGMQSQDSCFVFDNQLEFDDIENSVQGASGVGDMISDSIAASLGGFRDEA